MENNLSGAMSEHQNNNKSSNEQYISLMDIWLLVRKNKKLAIYIAAITLLIGSFLNFSLPSIYSYTTALEVGNQIVNDEIVPVEATETVIDKLNTGYIPIIKRKFLQDNPILKDEFIIEVRGSDKSQIVQIVSKGDVYKAEYINKLHSLIIESIILDHNRTIDSVKANAQILLSEAKEKLGGIASKENALRVQLESIRVTLESLDDYKLQLNKRITKAEQELERINSSNYQNKDIQSLMLTNQIGEWRSDLIEIENESKINIFVIRSEAEKELNNVENEKETAITEIRFRETSFDNIQETRSLGKEASMSIKPIEPNRLVIMFATIILSLVFSVLGILIYDFFSRSNQKTAQ